MLDPQLGAIGFGARYLYVIKGARAYHQGVAPTPQDVGVRALDDQTLVVELESPTGYFLHLMTNSVAFPVPRHAVEKHGPTWTEADKLVCNGAFLLDDWQPNQSLTLSRNPGYRGRMGGNVQRIEISVLDDDDEAALKVYEADRLDITGVPPARIEAVRRRHTAEYMTAPLALTVRVIVDQSRLPFDDVRVRRAFTQAIDRDALANLVLAGMVSPASGGFVPPGIPGHSAGIGLAYDPERARQTLAEAGYPSGQGFPEVDFLVNRGPVWNTTVEYLQAQWQTNLGVTIKPGFANTYQALIDRLSSKLPPAMWGEGWLLDYPDADSIFRSFPWTRKHNAVFAQLLDAAGRSSDPVERTRLYQAADRIVIDEARAIPLWYGRYHLLVKPWIRDFWLSPMRAWHWQDIVIEPH